MKILFYFVSTISFYVLGFRICLNRWLQSEAQFKLNQIKVDVFIGTFSASGNLRHVAEESSLEETVRQFDELINDLRRRQAWHGLRLANLKPLEAL